MSLEYLCPALFWCSESARACDYLFVALYLLVLTW